MKGTILVIDDSQATLGRMRTHLALAGYDVITSAQPVGTARHLRHADLVVIDYHMPGLDGANVLESLKAAVASSDSPPAFYLYTSDKDTEGRWRDLGFDGCFSDKGNDQYMVDQIEAFFRLRRLRSLSKK